MARIPFDMERPCHFIFVKKQSFFNIKKYPLESVDNAEFVRYDRNKYAGGINLKILVIDDSAVYRMQVIKLLREFLPEAEYIAAQDGIEGWNLYKKERPEVTLMDLLMPGLSGQEVLKLIKGMEAKAKVIILTADIQKYTRDEVEELGVTKFINKPISREKAAQIADVIKGD